LTVPGEIVVDPFASTGTWGRIICLVLTRLCPKRRAERPVHSAYRHR
jgi:hypothetical protein